MNNTAPNSTLNTPKVQFLSIDEDIAGQRIDNFLLTKLKGAPKSLIYRIVRKGEVRVNKGRIKPEYKLKAGDVVRVPPVRLAPISEQKKPGQGLTELLQKAVVYEDDTILVINKPSGLAVHGGSGIQLGLIESLRQVREGDKFLELVHRLDRDTSGCIMVAKSRRGLRFMQQQLRERQMNKVYQALVFGSWSKRCSKVDVALLKNQLPSGQRMVRAVDESTEGAKASLTRFNILESYLDCTLLEAKPVTGRTHQIRVHSQYAGHAILGDDKYGDQEQGALMKKIGLKRLFLHARRLDFINVNDQKVSVESPISQELQRVLDKLADRDK
jgi:23S rRNA pseudouridine955/2504/2580 synthase